MNTVTRLRKLGTMSAAEVRTRLTAAAYRACERRLVQSVGRTGSSSAVKLGARPLAALPAFRDPLHTRRVLTSTYGAGVEQAIARADRLLEGEVTLFGRAHKVGPSFDWHVDPVSGSRWPIVYHADVPIGDKANAPGDAKDVWELNRHQFLLDAAKAWFVTGRQPYADAVEHVVRSWIAQNPYGIGINWAGPLEVAYRALSWLWASQLLEGALSDRAREEWAAGFQNHGHFLYRHLELFESPYNHLIGEASVLFTLGTVLPELPEAGRWQQRGRDILESRLADQFYEDGGSVEQAVGYHHATLGFYLLSALIASGSGNDLPPAVWSAIQRGTEWAVHLQQPDGRHPAIGDNDDARPQAFARSDAWDFRHFPAAGAVLFGRPDFKHVAGTFPEDAFWLLGPEGLAQFAALPDLAPTSTSIALPTSGYVVLRSDWTASADYVCFDCGEQAGGLRHDGIPSAAHGHADALSVVVSLRGQPILVDGGFYTYDGDRTWERHFRETAAHNTISIDGRDQAQHLEKMAWVYTPKVELQNASVEGEGLWAIAAHDGYVRAAGVTHRRTVWLRRGGYVVLYDELLGSGAHSAEVAFHFSPELQATLLDSSVALGDRFTLSWSATCAVEPSLACGGPSPRDGWIAPQLGQKRSAPRLALSLKFTGAMRLLTIITDASRARIDHSTVEREACALAHRIAVGERAGVPDA